MNEKKLSLPKQHDLLIWTNNRLSFSVFFFGPHVCRVWWEYCWYYGRSKCFVLTPTIAQCLYFGDLILYSIIQHDGSYRWRYQIVQLIIITDYALFACMIDLDAVTKLFSISFEWVWWLRVICSIIWVGTFDGFNVNCNYSVPSTNIVNVKDYRLWLILCNKFSDLPIFMLFLLLMLVDGLSYFVCLFRVMSCWLPKAASVK